MDDTAPQPAPPPEEAWVAVNHILEVDSTENDSTFGDDTQSTSITDYRYENGRRYHAYHDGAYFLPNDEAEAERLDLQHHVWKMSINGDLHIAPLEEPIQNVLDVGTGTGIWAIEFAEQHPNAIVIGTDLSPIQPGFVPPNCSFMIDNAEDLWIYDRKFDFIHSRMLCMGMHDWPRFFKQSWDNMKPGGWIEAQEIQFPMRCADDTAGPDSPLLIWSDHIQEAGSRVGIDSAASSKFKEYLRDAGFINIREESVMWAIGSWPKNKADKNIGRWTRENFLQGLQGITMALYARHLGWSKEAIELFLVDVRKDLTDPHKHMYCQMTIHYAQKPPVHEKPLDDDRPQEIEKKTKTKKSTGGDKTPDMMGDHIFPETAEVETTIDTTGDDMIIDTVGDDETQDAKADNMATGSAGGNKLAEMMGGSRLAKTAGDKEVLDTTEEEKMPDFTGEFRLPEMAVPHMMKEETMLHMMGAEKAPDQTGEEMMPDTTERGKVPDSERGEKAAEATSDMARVEKVPTMTREEKMPETKAESKTLDTAQEAPMPSTAESTHLAPTS